MNNDYPKEERAEYETTRVPIGLVGVRDRSVIESRLDEISKCLNILGEEAATLTNRVTPVRRVELTTQSDVLGVDEPEEHASEIAKKLDQLNRQIRYIQSNIRNAINELEI